MPNKYLNMWRKQLPNVQYANLYGPTEITDVCTAYIIDREFADDEDLPIGKACRNTGIILITDDNKEAEQGEIGEICVRGRSLALGYFGDFSKSSEAFVQNPTNDKYRDIIYKTGDLGKYNDRGELLYLGRKDYQIKHMGHRIELGEIETAAGVVDGVETCACVYDDQKGRIVLFYSGPAESALIREVLATKLPDYMIPNIMKQIDCFPYNANGKIDRKVLKTTL